MIFTKNNPCLCFQTPFMSFWFYSVASVVCFKQPTHDCACVRMVKNDEKQ